MEGIADLRHVLLNASAIFLKLGIEEPANILNHDGTRADDTDEFNHRGEQIAFIVSAELLSGVRERRTWNAPCDQVDAAVFVRVFLNPWNDIPLNDIPVWAVFAKGITGMMIDFDDGEVIEPCLFKAERLATSTGTDLNRCQSHVPPSATVSTG